MLTLDIAVPGRLQARLQVADEVVAVVGPNGSGKTTLLHAVAGTLEHPSQVSLAGRDWTPLPAHARRVGLVHQDHQLFPHLSVLENVAFGPRARGRSRSTARHDALAQLERVGLAALADRRPHQLSGGQAQRVALARALATGPDVLLLDEPFAALDVAVAHELRETLRTQLEDFAGPVLLTTHDPLDVGVLARRVVVLDAGRVVQDGRAREVADAPASSHVAQLLGVNVVRGTATDGVVRLGTGTSLVAATQATGEVVATFPPSAVTLTAERPTGSARNAWPVHVVGVAHLDAAVRLHLRAARGWDLRADVTLGAAEQLGLTAGAAAWASVKATEVTVFSTARARGGEAVSR